MPCKINGFRNFEFLIIISINTTLGKLPYILPS